MAQPRPFGHDCVRENGVRFCPTEGLEERVKSFDGIPLDVDVTLPPTGDGPFPTIVMLHGYGESKARFEADPAAGRAGDYHYNNVYFARRGYAVVNYSARGFGRSCGQQRTAPTAECAKGYIHLADQRFEARDTQFLLGRLVDRGISSRRRLGVTGVSYGGGQTVELGQLRNRVRRRDGTFAAWRSPRGARLRIAAAFPRIPWSDLPYALLPNGRLLDFLVSTPTESRRPIGVPIQSFINGLYLLGKTSGYYCGDAPGSSPCTDESADINSQFGEVVRGEPISARGRAQINEIARFHDGFGIPGRPAPVLIESGWTDDLFPVHEALRVYNHARSLHRRARVSLLFGDLGHMRGSNKRNTLRFFSDRGSRFFDAYLKGTRTPPRPGSVTTFTQTCPREAPGGGPFTARSWPRIHPGAVRFGSAPAQTVTSTGGNPETARRFDPVTNSDACQTVPVERAPGTGVYLGPRSRGFTLMGRPTVSARVATTGRFGQLDSRLWDVAPDGAQRLVSRAAYRLNDDQAGRIILQLNGNGYRFAPGHRPKLELLGRDAAAVAALGTLGSGYLRPSNSVFSVRVSRLTIELPVLEPPDGRQIVRPRLGAAPRMKLSVSPRRTRVGRRTRFRFRATVLVAGRRRPAVGTTVVFAGRRKRVSASGRVSFVERFRTAGRRRARASNGISRARASVLVRGRARPRFTG